MKKYKKTILCALMGFLVHAAFTIIDGCYREILPDSLYVMVVIVKYMGMVIFCYNLNKLDISSGGDWVERNDERNITIRNRTKAKCFDILSCVMIIVFAVYFELSYETAYFLLFIGICLFMIAVYFYYKRKYEKEL